MKGEIGFNACNQGVKEMCQNEHDNRVELSKSVQIDMFGVFLTV